MDEKKYEAPMAEVISFDDEVFTAGSGHALPTPGGSTQANYNIWDVEE